MQITINAPFSKIALFAENDILRRIQFMPKNTPLTELPEFGVLREAAFQMQKYFADARYNFCLNYELNGSEFQRKVWQEISNIGCGQTKTYGEIAQKICSSPRPIGGACAQNPIPIIVPCHRVVAKNGLGGFCHHQEKNSYLLQIKLWLLQHEQAKYK